MVKAYLSPSTPHPHPPSPTQRCMRRAINIVCRACVIRFLFMFGNVRMVSVMFCPGTAVPHPITICRDVETDCCYGRLGV